MTKPIKYPAKGNQEKILEEIRNLPAETETGKKAREKAANIVKRAFSRCEEPDGFDWFYANSQLGSNAFHWDEEEAKNVFTGAMYVLETNAEKLWKKDSVLAINLQQWYRQTYPSDLFGAALRPNITFVNVRKALNAKADIYETLGVIDSLVRQRVFSKLAELLECDIDSVYDAWHGRLKGGYL